MVSPFGALCLELLTAENADDMLWTAYHVEMKVGMSCKSLLADPVEHSLVDH